MRLTNHHWGIKKSAEKKPSTWAFFTILWGQVSWVLIRSLGRGQSNSPLQMKLWEDRQTPEVLGIGVRRQSQEPRVRRRCPWGQEHVGQPRAGEGGEHAQKSLAGLVSWWGHCGLSCQTEIKCDLIKSCLLLNRTQLPYKATVSFKHTLRGEINVSYS